MKKKTFSRWVAPVAAVAGVGTIAAASAYWVGPGAGQEGSPAAVSAPYPFVISQNDGLRIGDNTIPRPDGFLWADVSGNSLLTLTASAGSFGTVSRSALDGTGATPIATGVIGVPLVNAVTGTITVLTRQTLEDLTPTLKKVVIDTGAVIDTVVAPIGTLLSSLKPNGQTIINSGLDAFLWNTVQNLLQLLVEPSTVATQTILTSATSTFEFHEDFQTETSFLVARPSGEHVRTFNELLDGKIVGDKLVLWNVDDGEISRTTTTATGESTPAPLPAGFDLIMAWHGDNFLARVQDIAPGQEPDDAGPGTSTYFDCDAIAWECTQIGSTVDTGISNELGSTPSWQLRAALQLDLGPVGVPDDLPDSEDPPE